MQGKGRPLILRAWAPGDELAETTWGIREPLSSAPEVSPDVVLVPLLAFDPPATGSAMAEASMTARSPSAAKEANRRGRPRLRRAKGRRRAPFRL